MGQNNVTSKILKTIGTSIITEGEILLSSWNIKSNLSVTEGIIYSSTRNEFPRYLNQNIYQKGIKNLMLRLDGGDGKLYLRDELNESKITLDFKFESNSELCIPYIKARNSSSNKYTVNKNGQLFVNTNFQIYHIGRKSTDEEITKFKTFYKKVFNVTTDISAGYDLTDLAGWRITTSKDRPTYFVVRGQDIDVLPRNPLLYPPNVDDITKSKYQDIQNWPFKIIKGSTGVIPKFEGGAYGCGSTIGRCENPKIGEWDCNGGIPKNIPTGYKMTSGFWYKSSQPADKPLIGSEQKGIFVVDEKDISQNAREWKQNWSESTNRKTIHTPICPTSYKPLGSVVKDSFTSLSSIKYGCVNNKFIQDDKSFVYDTTKDKTVWNEVGCGSQDDGACFFNTKETDLSMYCTGPTNVFKCVDYDLKNNCRQSAYANPDEKPYKLIPYSRMKNICLGNETAIDQQDVDESRKLKPGIGNCNDLMIDVCSREPNSDECLKYLIRHINPEKGTGDDLDKWVQNFCNTLTTEEKTSDKYSKLCGCHLTPEEYAKIKEKMLYNLSQGDESKKTYFLPLLDGLPKCWYPDCNSATSVPNIAAIGPGKECRNLNFNNCISQCNINNKGEIGNIACTQDQQCKIVVEGSREVTPTPSPGPSGSPAPTKSFFEKNKILIISIASFIILLIIVILIIVIAKSGKK